MLRIIINILILLFVVRVVGSLAKAVRRRFGQTAPSRRKGREDGDIKGESYDGLSPYEIEDADYEEIKPEQE